MQPSDSDSKYLLAKFGHAQKKKFLGLNVRPLAKIDFYFSLSPLPSFFAFLAPFFISLAEHLVGFILVGKVFREALGSWDGRWVVEQDFHGNFQVNVTWYLLFLRCP